MLTDTEMHKLENASTEAAWNRACDDVKRARGGAYPGDWFLRVVASGLIARKSEEFSAHRRNERTMDTHKITSRTLKRRRPYGVSCRAWMRRLATDMILPTTTRHTAHAWCRRKGILVGPGTNTYGGPV